MSALHPNASMTRPAWLFAIAAMLFVAHLIARAAGLADHTSAIAGMPISAASWTLGPLHVLLYLLVVVVAPILTIAATIDTLITLRGRRSA